MPSLKRFGCSSFARLQWIGMLLAKCCNMFNYLRHAGQTELEWIWENHIRDWQNQLNAPSKAELKNLGKTKHLILSSRWILFRYRTFRQQLFVDSLTAQECKIVEKMPWGKALQCCLTNDFNFCYLRKNIHCNADTEVSLRSAYRKRSTRMRFYRRICNSPLSRKYCIANVPPKSIMSAEIKHLPPPVHSL